MIDGVGRRSVALAVMALAVSGSVLPSVPAGATSPGLAYGYAVVGADGSVRPFGFGGGTDRIRLGASGGNAVAMVATYRDHTGGAGLLVIDDRGVVQPVSDSVSLGDLRGHVLAAPIVGAAPVWHGYYMVGADGGVFTFGRARFYGSLGGRPLPAPIVGIAVAADELGYWLVDARGRVYPFGPAPWLGDMRRVALAAPVVGIASAPFPHTGYVLAAADGGVFTFGDTRFYGSMAGTNLWAPIAGVSTTNARGYYLVARDGGVFAFGEPYLGGLGGTKVPAPIVGIVAGIY